MGLVVIERILCLTDSGEKQRSFGAQCLGNKKLIRSWEQEWVRWKGNVWQTKEF